MKIFRNGLALALIWSAGIIAGPALADTLECTKILRTWGVDSYSFLKPKTFASKSHEYVVTQLNTYYDRNPNQMRELGALLTMEHALNENNFQVKNPKTGRFDKFNPVRVTPFIAPMPWSQLQSLARSTEPLLRELRRLLQKAYSANGELTIESLGLQEWPNSDALRILEIIRASIYYEPYLKDPEMKDYPFLSIAGFDASLGDPGDVSPQFFEINLGTPSGLSNNIQLLQELQQTDYTMSDIIKKHAVPDDTFSKLRSTIEQNALAWTGIRDGISVIIGPGIYNGAHPDVAAISRYSGMPLVQANDLYIDEQGFVRLNLGENKDHPKVSGIYGRVDESFLFQSNDDGIPWVSPTIGATPELSRSLGLPLRTGAVYEWITDSKGKITGVKQDGNGNPKFQQAWDQPKGSLAKAVKSRKLYFSGLGGRVVDDKRLFPLIAKQILKSHSNAARPVNSLPRDQYHLFFENPGRFVVKEPSNSGGSGVSIMSLLNKKERTEIVRAVRERPDSFEIQYLSEITTAKDILNGKPIDVATDLRLYVMFDSQGNASISPNSVLLRTAPPGGLHSNTSRGGGYGIMVAIDDQSSERPLAPDESSLHKPQEFISDRRSSDFQEVLVSLLDFEERIWQVYDAKSFQALRYRASELSYMIRRLMDLIPKSTHSLIGRLRDWAQDEESHPHYLAEEIAHFISRLRTSSTVLPKPLAANFEEYWQQYGFFWLMKLNSPESGNGERLKALSVNMFKEPETVYRYFTEKMVKQEIGSVESISEPVMAGLLNEIKSLGSELRIVRKRYYTENGDLHYDFKDQPYFWVNYTLADLTSYLRPIIAFDPMAPNALEGLCHEIAHLKYWKTIYDNLRAQGMGHSDAVLASAKQIENDDEWIASEHAAVKAEMECEEKYSGNLFASYKPRARHFSEIRYINRITYPEFSVLKKHLVNIKSIDGEPTPQQANSLKRSRELMMILVSAAIEGRKKAITYLRGKQDSYELKQWERINNAELLIFPYGAEELESMGTYEIFLRLFYEISAGAPAA